MSSARLNLTALTVALVVISLVILSTPGARSAAAAGFQASVDFSNTQGYRGWSYHDSSGTLLTYDAVNQVWRGSEPYLLIWWNGIHPGASLGAMRRWTAPEAGTIRMTGSARDTDPGGGDGVEFVIRRNGSVLWRAAIANGNTTGVKFDLALSVASKDALDFIVNRGLANNSNDSSYFDPIITYGTSTSEPPPPPPPIDDSTTSEASDDSTTSEASVEVSGLHERLLGPVVPLAQWTDSIEQSAAAVLAKKPVTFLLTELANSNVDYGWLGPNYYDRTAWCYRYAAASGRADILGRCRFYARGVSNAPMMANHECLARTGDYVTCSPRTANRDNQGLGLALAATDARDPTTQAVAKNGLARSAYGGYRLVPTNRFIDPRENGNGLLAVALSHAVGPSATPARWGIPWDSAARARTMLEVILAGQQAWGCWNTSYATSGIIETPTYMQGLVLDGLAAYYDFVQADSRILPAIKRCASWLKAKYHPAPNPANADNRLGEGGWVYSYRADGQTVVNGNVYPSLSGMIIGPLGWLWLRTRDAQWYTLADAACKGLVREGVAGPGTGIGTSKEANQWARPVVNWMSTR